MKEVETKIIGKKMYPVDNSYSFTIGIDQYPYLAGTCNTLAKKVLIVSEPYKLEVTKYSKPRYLEFVTVSYKGRFHVVMNNFSETQPVDLNSELNYLDAW